MLRVQALRLSSSLFRYTGHRCSRYIRQITFSPRQFCFSIISISIWSSKILHIYTHATSISKIRLFLWCPTFFLQDVIFITLARILLADRSGSLTDVLSKALALLLSTGLLFMVAVEHAFYMTVQSELRWCLALNSPKDPASGRLVLSGLLDVLKISTGVLIVSVVLTPRIFDMTGSLIHSLDPQSFWQISQEPGDSYSLSIRARESDQSCQSSKVSNFYQRLLLRVLVGWLVLLQFMRPHEAIYMHISWTLPIAPLLCLGNSVLDSSTSLEELNSELSNCRVYAPLPKFDWLTEQKLAGFQDWYEYPELNNAQLDQPCFHISNLEDELLKPLRIVLEGNLKIKHIVLIMLESTRKDVFPLQKESPAWNRIIESYKDHKIPLDVEKALSRLTPTVDWLTGNSGNHSGGIIASNAFASATYSFKSLVGTLCGIPPLPIDFNVEHRSHIYRPCLPHIVEALSLFASNRTEDFKSWPWTSVFMQSVTEDFDEQAALIKALGFQTSITRETLIDPESPHYPPKHGDINYFGLPEVELKPYLRDLVQTAESHQERLFLTHFTSTTHHPWALPSDYPYQQYLAYSGYGLNRKVNRYLNTLAYVDSWLGDIFQLFKEFNTLNETLFILMGDHGIGLPSSGGDTPYDNPHVGSFHVPLVISHPALPAIEIKDPVIATQVLPTILDLLVSSGSLDSRSKKAATDLISIYEGQSLLRPLVHTTRTGRKSWQISIMNPGGAGVAIRSTTNPYRLIVPILKELAWRFTDLSKDPQEDQPLSSFNWDEFIALVQEIHGSDAVEWTKEASTMARWWIPENRRLWRWNDTLS